MLVSRWKCDARGFRLRMPEPRSSPVFAVAWRCLRRTLANRESSWVAAIANRGTRSEELEITSRQELGELRYSTSEVREPMTEIEKQMAKQRGTKGMV